jgi:hypothetical protein
VADCHDVAELPDRPSQSTVTRAYASSQRQPLELRATAWTSHANPRHAQLDAMLEQRQIPNPPFLPIMDRDAVTSAAAAASQMTMDRLEPDHAPGMVLASLK